MLIKVINPNTTATMTAMIGAAARSVAAADTVIVAANPDFGPASIESHYEEALSVPNLLDEIAAGERDGADGYVIACFGDPGLDAARELARGPVVAIAEAAMHAATFLGRSFSVVTTLRRTTGRARDLVGHYGFSRQCVGIRACEVQVLELERPGSGARELILAECRSAIAEDDCDSIVLGCAGMADLAAGLSADLGVPVIDGVTAAVGTVQALVRAGLGTSKRGEFASPPSKHFRTAGV
jgi:allantoin racemase